MAPPPSYESAVSRKAWPLVVPYVHPTDLSSLCLASRDFHNVFAPKLWRDPALLFGTDSDTVYLSITRFKRLLVRARLEVRKLTHVLHIPPAQPEFYGGPQNGWLKEILDRLPLLQALVVSNLAFFDHQALQQTHNRDKSRSGDGKYGLRLLVAASCENTTATSLASALQHFPELLYLDLSSAHGSRSPSVLAEIGNLKQLRVLKMRNCGLRDHDMDQLLLPTRLRSLDLGENYLTEKGVTALINRLPAACKPFGHGGNERRTTSHLSSRRSSLQSYVYNKLTNCTDGYLDVEDGLPSTFTELYIAGNFITMDELSNALAYLSIEYLDCGSLNSSQRPVELLSPGSPGSDRRRFSSAETDKVSPVLFTNAFRNLTSLRIHHSIITGHPFSGNGIPVANQCFELHSEDLRYELDSTELIFELDDTSVNNISETEEAIEDKVSFVYPSESHFSCESPDDVGPALHLPAVSTAQDNISNRRSFDSLVGSSAQRGLPLKISTPSKPITGIPSHILPQKFLTRPTDDQNPAVLPPTSAPLGPEKVVYKYSLGVERNWQEAGLNGAKASTPREILDGVLQRRNRTEAREREPGRFRPSMLPSLKNLTLTDVPASTRRQAVIDSLALFIQECAEEEEIARLEESSNRGNSERKRQKSTMNSTLKLERLTLEMTSAPDPIAPPRSPRESRISFTKSSREDYDSEVFSEASESDFSFFGEDDGGLLVGAGRIDPPVRVDDGMIVSNDRCGFADVGHSIDVVSELSSFRREQKARNSAAMKYGACPIEAALIGHWRGEIKVVRPFVLGT